MDISNAEDSIEDVSFVVKIRALLHSLAKSRTSGSDVIGIRNNALAMSVRAGFSSSGLARLRIDVINWSPKHVANCSLIGSFVASERPYLIAKMIFSFLDKKCLHTIFFVRVVCR